MLLATNAAKSIFLRGKAGHNKRGQKELSREDRGEFAYTKICVHKFACTRVTQKKNRARTLTHAAPRMSNKFVIEKTAVKKYL